MGYNYYMPSTIASMSHVPVGNNPAATGPAFASVGANSVPNQRQTANGLLPVTQLDKSGPYRPRQQPMIASPRLAPSTISTEQALASRAQMAPEFIHNVMVTRMLRTSNIYSDMPRFRNQLDILA